ncbi:hypothetical protein FTX61_17075 [Nitriliruptoraceae bacterium ZYF776]|nr:hypothetical protein [Profundirhabdus halotolerans]
MVRTPPDTLPAPPLPRPATNATATRLVLRAVLVGALTAQLIVATVMVLAGILAPGTFGSLEALVWPLLAFVFGAPVAVVVAVRSHRRSLAALPAHRRSVAPRAVAPDTGWGRFGRGFGAALLGAWGSGLALAVPLRVAGVRDLAELPVAVAVGLHLARLVAWVALAVWLYRRWGARAEGVAPRPPTGG